MSAVSVVAPTSDSLTERQIYVTQDVNPLQTLRVSSNLVHNVLTIATRSRIVSWIFQTADAEGETLLPSKTVRKFLDCFGDTVNSNMMRSRRLWADLAKYESIHDENMQDGAKSSITRVTNKVPKRGRLKARSGRGRRHSVWAKALHA